MYSGKCRSTNGYSMHSMYMLAKILTHNNSEMQTRWKIENTSRGNAIQKLFHGPEDKFQINDSYKKGRLLSCIKIAQVLLKLQLPLYSNVLFCPDHTYSHTFCCMEHLLKQDIHLCLDQFADLAYYPVHQVPAELQKTRKMNRDQRLYRRWHWWNPNTDQCKGVEIQAWTRKYACWQRAQNHLLPRHMPHGAVTHFASLSKIFFSQQENRLKRRLIWSDSRFPTPVELLKLPY